MLVHTHTYAWNAARVVESRSGGLQRSYSYPKCVSPRVSFRQVQTGLYLRKAIVVTLCASAIFVPVLCECSFFANSFLFLNFNNRDMKGSVTWLMWYMYNVSSYWCNVQIGGRGWLCLSMNEVQWVVKKLISCAGTWRKDLGEQRHATAELIRLEVSLHQRKERVLLYSCPCFSDMRPASLLRTTVADGPQPPLEDRTRRVKVPCSTSMMHFSHAHLFSCSCLL